MIQNDYDVMKPRSQKAKGVILLRKLSNKPVSANSLDCMLMQEAIDMSKPQDVLMAASFLRRFYQRVIFVRPCPVTPRHGFEDSVKIDQQDGGAIEEPYKSMVSDWYWNFEWTIRQLNAILAKAQAIDPQAELLIMRYIDATFNLVSAGNSLSIGPGNDGATAGKNAISLPCAPIPVTDELKLRAGIKDSVFMEFVTDAISGKLFITQLRDGPEVSNRDEFIPKSMLVTEVYEIPTDGTGPSLTTWELMCKSDEFHKEGFIVWHPGGTMSTHYAIHCRLNNIAITTSAEKPLINDQFLPSESQDNKVLSPDRHSLRWAIEEAINWKRIPAKDVYNLPLYILHNYQAFDLSNSVHVRLLGWGLGLGLKLSVAALWGERRHAAQPYLQPDGVYQESLHTQNQCKRETRYNEVFSATSKFEDLLHRIARESVAFGYKGWGGNLFGAGVGGLKWLQCADVTYKLWNKLVDYLHGWCQFSEVILALNEVVNVSHNGAKLLTKHISLGAFETATHRPWEITMRIAVPLYNRLTKSENYQKAKKRVTMSFHHSIMPSEKVKSEELRKAYKSLIVAEGNGSYAMILSQIPDEREGNDWTDHAYNTIRGAVIGLCEKKHIAFKNHLPNDEDDKVAWPRIDGPWNIKNPWYNATSPVNWNMVIKIGSTDGLNTLVDPNETLESLALMKAEPKETGKYPYYWDSVGAYWIPNKLYQKVIQVDLGAMEESVLTGETPQLEA